MTKGGEVLKNNYTVSSRKRFLFYILIIFRQSGQDSHRILCFYIILSRNADLFTASI